MFDVDRPPRARLLRRLEARLLRRGAPRLFVFLLVLATAMVGFLTSVGLHAEGLTVMWLRYGLSVIAAYGFFLFLVWLWILRRRGTRVSLDQADLTDAARGAADPGGSDGGGFDLDGEGVAILLILLLALAIAALAALYVVVTAPALLAELLLDGVAGAALYRRLRTVERRPWLRTAFARTWLPALWTTVVFTAIGAVCQAYAPEATTMGGVLRHDDAADVNPDENPDLDVGAP